MRAMMMFAVVMALGCTDQGTARSFGGAAELELPRGQRLVTVTWKEANIWYLTRPFRDDEIPETYTFKESSEFGAFQGTITLKERR